MKVEIVQVGEGKYRARIAAEYGAEREVLAAVCHDNVCTWECSLECIARHLSRVLNFLYITALNACHGSADCLTRVVGKLADLDIASTL